jgi:stage V sporulation protein B
VLFFSSEYSEGAPVLAILSLALCVALTSNLMGISLVALGQPDKPVKINIVETITNIIANLVLIPIYGLIGAAFATLLSRCITNPVNLYFLKKTEISVDVSQYIKPLIVCVSLIIVNIYLSPKVFLSKSLLELLVIYYQYVINLTLSTFTN